MSPWTRPSRPDPRALAIRLFAVLALPWAGAAAGGLPTGAAEQAVMVDGRSLAVFFYKPPGYVDGPLILAFHGSDRRPDAVRDRLAPLADRVGAIVVAPLFDAQRFPPLNYQFGGMVERAGSGPETGHRLRPATDWTGALVLGLVAHLRREENCPDLPYYLIGHSAGAQFLGRVAAFVRHGAERIVLANAGTYVFPSTDMRFPYGFGGLPDPSGANDRVRAYMRQPVTIYLGTEDTRREGLNVRPGAERQGATRVERGRNAFAAARETALREGWEFGWSLVEAPGAGHGIGRMYRDPAVGDALFGPQGHPVRAACRAAAE